MSRVGTPLGFNLRRPNLPIPAPLQPTTSSQGTNGPTGGGPSRGAGGVGGGAGAGAGAARQGVISVEEWEARAPLDETMQALVKEVGEELVVRPMPEKFRKQPEAGPSSRPSTPQGHPVPRRIAHLNRSPGLGGASSRSRTPLGSRTGTPNPGASSQLLSAPDHLHPDIITTPQEFQDHFTALTLSTEHEQDSLYRDHLAEIVGLKEKCDELVGLLQGAEGEVGEMLAALEYVEERSQSLRGACEDLLEEQTHLLTHTSQLAHRLTFFTFLESSQRMLNTPSPTLVLSEDFLPMLKRLDECITYLGEHRDFKDAELYLIRYQQCMTRSMTLIKIYFTNTLRSLGQEVGKKVFEKSLSETATQALLFPKFTGLSTTLRPLVQELEKRAVASADELGPLLGECHAAWIGVRHSLMAPRVAEEVGRLDPVRSELIELTRTGCGYLKQMCLEEFNLFKSFFLSGESQLYSYLESLCDALYDSLRPRILHEPNLEILCGVCTVLQALMVQDVSEMPTEDDETAIYTPYSPSPSADGFTPSPSASQFGGAGTINGEREREDYFSSALSPRIERRSSGLNLRQASWSSTPRIGTPRVHSGPHSRAASALARRRDLARKRRPLGRLHTEVLLRMVLHDAQTRLVFRAQAMIQAEVEYYAVKEGDLDYPAKLGKGDTKHLVARPENTIPLDSEGYEEPAFLALPPKESQEAWYPTLRTTLWVLSCLWTYVDSSLPLRARALFFLPGRSIGRYTFRSEVHADAMQSVVFEDLAQDAIITCRRSLSAAADLLAGKKDKAMDGRLFLVRHLLILKEMTAGLDLGRRVGRKDWGGITDFLRSLLENASVMLGYSQRAARTHEPISDAKTDVDRELKRVCEELIAAVATSAVMPLRVFLDKCNAHLASRAVGSGAATTTSDLPSQPFATAEKVREVHDEFKAEVGGKVQAWKGELKRYLMDDDTVEVLVPPAHNAIVEAYRQFHDLVRAEYDFATAASIMTPSALSTLLAQ